MDMIKEDELKFKKLFEKDSQAYEEIYTKYKDK
jgi:hypothetical protein